jgi:hypothetical protein
MGCRGSEVQILSSRPIIEITLNNNFQLIPVKKSYLKGYAEGWPLKVNKILLEENFLELQNQLRKNLNR